MELEQLRQIEHQIDADIRDVFANMDLRLLVVRLLIMTVVLSNGTLPWLIPT